MSDTAAFILLMALLIAVMIGLVSYSLYYLTVNIMNPDGKGADKTTRRILSRFALPRRFKVLSHIKLEHKGKSAEIENLLIGYFGLLMVTTCGARGEYYGEIDNERWILVQDGKKTGFPNPVAMQEHATGLLRTILSQNKIYNVPVEHIVVISNRSKKTKLFITHSGQILPDGKLGAYLDKTKFEADTGLDVEKIAAVLRDNQNNNAK